MSSYNISLTLENIRTITVMFLDIFIMWLVLYYAIRLVRSNTKTIQIFKGILLVIIIDGIAKFLGLKTVQYLTDMFINWGFLAIIIIFQPEIRSLLERLGKTNVFSRITTLTGNEKENLVDQIVTATMLLSKDQTGALICIEQNHPLDDFIATGTKLNSDVTAELLTSIFVTSTPLHDGAVIIQGDKIACASAYFPPTNLELPGRYGARHRAAIGISEITDAVTIVVSEETGAVSITEGGKIISVNRRQLRDYLLRVICGEETEVHGSGRKLNNEKPREVIIDDTQELKKEGKTGNTGVLSRLAIKKQEAKEQKPEKIEAEEVIPAEQPEVIISDEDENMKKLDEEAAEIKLPHKKARPAPSYPENDSVKRFEKERQHEEELREKEEAIRQEQLAQKKAAEEAERRRKAAEEAERQRKAAEEAERKCKAAEEAKRLEAEARVQEPVEAAPRMTPEQVRAAREAAYQKFSSARKPEVKKESESSQNQDSQFDTTKLDLGELMGMNEDLDKTFEVIDSIDSKKKSSKTSDDSSQQEGGSRK